MVEEWARKAVAQSEEGKWQACLAETFYNIECFADSVTRFRAALETMPTDWKLSLGLAQALGKNDEFKEAVETLEKLIEDNQALIATDDDFKAEYWDSMLLLIGDWNIQLKDFAAAELTYKKLLKEGLTKDTFEAFARKAVLLISLALNEQSKYQETMDLLTSLEQHTDPEAGNWLSVLLQFYAGTDDLHDRIFEAAHNSNQLNAVTEKYRQAVENIHTDKTKIGMYLHLRYWLAALMWSHQSREEKEAALDMWEDIMNIELPEGTDDDYMVSWARSLTAPRFARTLLDSAKQAGLTMPLNPAAEAYAMRLEKLTHGDPDYVRGSWDDVRISLGRLHHLAGDEVRAKSIVREIMKTGLQSAAEHTSVSLMSGMYRVAVVLQALDDDDNAIAAWRYFTPKVADASDDEESVEGTAEDDDDNEANDPEKADNDQAAASKDEKEDAREEQAVAGAERPETRRIEIIQPSKTEEPKPIDSTGTEQTNDHPTPSEAKPAEAEKEEAPLSGVLSSHCDGHCGVNWTYVDNIYACKDCLDVQLEPNCYAKLQNGTLDPKVCDKSHSHIYIPPFDRQKWEELGDDEMWVGENVVKIKDWIEEIKKQWQIDDKSLQAKERLVKAITKIQKAWRLFKPPVVA